MSKNGNSLRKNLGLQTFYQVLATCLPLITAPYLTRTLGAEQQGIYSYTASIVNYFALFAIMGLSGYGTRSIAAVGNDKEKRSETFWSIYSLQLITSITMLGLYILYAIFICKENRSIALIQTIAIFPCVFGISWLFFGMEKFKLTVTRSIIIRLLTVAAILIFVKTKSDLWKYTLIMVSGNALGELIFWIYLPNYVSFKKVAFTDVIVHFKPNFLLFLPLLAMSVYHLMDKTMLGLLSTYQQSGFYYNADKIINIPIGVISGISTVMLPRISSLLGQGKNDEADNMFRVSLEGTIVIGTAIAFGIAAIANEFEPVFFGPGFEECILLTIALAPVLLIKSFAFTARYQYLVPHKKEKDYTLSVIAGAIVNFFLNYCLIPRLGAMGAVLGTVFAELTACVWQYMTIRSMIDLREVLKNCVIYFAFGFFMFIGVRLVSLISINRYLLIILEIMVGAVLYLVLCKFYWIKAKNPIQNMILGDFLHLKRNR